MRVDKEFYSFPDSNPTTYYNTKDPIVELKSHRETNLSAQGLGHKIPLNHNVFFLPLIFTRARIIFYGDESIKLILPISTNTE